MKKALNLRKPCCLLLLPLLLGGCLAGTGANADLQANVLGQLVSGGISAVGAGSPSVAASSVGAAGGYALGHTISGGDKEAANEAAGWGAMGGGLIGVDRIMRGKR